MRFLALLLVLVAEASSAQGESPATAPLEPISSPYLIKLTGGLVAIVVIIFVLAWAVKKFNLNQQAGSGLLRIVAGISIGTRDRIVLLQVGEEQILVAEVRVPVLQAVEHVVGEEQILLGLSPGRIEKLHTLAEPLQSPQGQHAAGAFASRLNRLMSEKESS